MLFAPAQSYTSYRNEQNKIAIYKPFYMGTKINLIKSSFHFSSAFVGTNKLNSVRNIFNSSIIQLNKSVSTRHFGLRPGKQILFSQINYNK